MIYTTTGYNRWCRPWPAAVPVWQRYPISAPKTAAWPFEWLGRQVDATANLPAYIPGNVYLNFLRVDEATWRWNCIPSIVGEGSVTFVLKAVGGTFEEPLGIFTDMEFSGGHADEWEAAQIFLPYDRPYQFNRNYQAERFFLRVFETGPGAAHFAIWEFFTARCGREWNIANPS